MNWRATISVVGAGLMLPACRREAVTPASPPAATAPSVGGRPLPAQAQPKLRTIRLWLGAEEMKAELAVTPEQITAGLMFRTNLEPNAGMLFLLGQPVHPAFWMKNCSMDLSAAFIDPSGIIVELHDFQAQNTNPVVATSYNVQYVLEASRGWFEQHHIGGGMLVRTEYGSFPQTFTPKRPVAR